MNAGCWSTPRRRDRFRLSFTPSPARVQGQLPTVTWHVARRRVSVCSLCDCQAGRAGSRSRCGATCRLWSPSARRISAPRARAWRVVHSAGGLFRSIRRLRGGAETGAGGTRIMRARRSQAGGPQCMGHVVAHGPFAERSFPEGAAQGRDRLLRSRSRQQQVLVLRARATGRPEVWRGLRRGTSRRWRSGNICAPTDFAAMSRHTLRLVASPVRAYDMLSPGRDARVSPLGRLDRRARSPPGSTATAC